MNTTDPFLFVFPFFPQLLLRMLTHTIVQGNMCFLCFSSVNPDLWISVLCEVNCRCGRIKEEENGPVGCSTRKGIKEESRKRKDVYRG